MLRNIPEEQKLLVLYLLSWTDVSLTLIFFQYKGYVSESGDFKNVMNSKSFHLFSFNTYEHNVYVKEFTFFQFKFNPFNNLTR